jgi:predicted ArsR family transcriptional regulator
VSRDSIARVLEDGRRRRLLLSLVHQERSLKEAAELNGLPLNLAHYHVSKLVAADLVEITRERKRAGRPVRYYRARYSAYFIPAALLRSRPTDQLARSLAKGLESARDRSGAGLLLDVDDAGRARMREAAGSAPAPLEVWRRLNVSRKEAEALFLELTATIHRYEKSRPRSRSSWTMHLALAETPS